MKYINSKKKLIGIIALAIILIAAAGFIFYVSDYYHADNTALAALKSTNSYTVNNTDDSITFTPTKNKSNTGIIIYPGGKVQAESYSVIASKLASEGYTAIIVKMPFNLAFFGADKADDVIADYPEIETWVIGGHSLGGVFASDYAVDNQDKIKGVIYLAAYPSSNASNATFKTLSIRGSLDNLTTSEDIEKNKNKFPANTTFITINGGNHYNYGNYRVQTGDNNSTITREQQQEQTVNAILEFLKNL
ncbi:alpha/beta hydrolase [Methanobacterium oryzae]|uniref:alpha/beta hydrolase n=1 Tax=Methanobacterium oryzae TaxID=69540 RepID=UPI003D251D15